ncbi:hypothetical protein [Treponema parvum]|uniref:hypothetical protein n=1 Tax=Treponema parvum TaxID=138851 RepID=UPI003D363FFB
MPKHNRRYKDSVFVDLFSTDKDAKVRFLSLYNALHGTHLDSSTELKPRSGTNPNVRNCLMMCRAQVDNEIIVLAEHQSANVNEKICLYAVCQYVAACTSRFKFSSKVPQNACKDSHA